MAATERIFVDFVAGVLSETLADDGTTLKGTFLASLPEVADPEFVALTLDPQEVDGAPEVVWVTAHSSGSDEATVVRAREGTVAREHVSGTVAVAAVTATALEDLKLADGEVTAEKIAAGAVTTPKIAAGAVTSAQIGEGAVIRSRLADGAVGAAQIGDGHVTTDKIASNAVTGPKLAVGAVTFSRIADGAVIASKIAGNAISAFERSGATVEAAVDVPTSAGNLATVTLNIPSTWSSWNCVAFAQATAMFLGAGTKILTLRVRIDGTDDKTFDYEIGSGGDGAGAVAAASFRSGITTTGNRTITLRGNASAGGVVLPTVFLYVRAFRTS